MNIFPLVAVGVSTLNSSDDLLDVRYHLILNKEQELLNTLNIDNPGFDNLYSMASGEENKEFFESISSSLSVTSRQRLIFHKIDKDVPISNICDAYLKLYLLSLKVSKPNSINLENIFGSLANVAWTNLGPVDVKDLNLFRSKNKEVFVRSVDKFPCLTDYIIPEGVRIADCSRVRLGAHLSEGTTVMHEGFVNFNAGTLGSAMIEGRKSAGVVIGKNTDLGGGCSTKGT